MSTELEALFDGITSNDQEVLDSVYERLENQMNNPEFIFFLFQSLTDELLQNNPTIYMLVQIQIFNNIRSKWTNIFNEDIPVYWTQDIQENIALTLVEAVFSIPSSHRKHFIPPIKYIIEKNFPNVGNIMNKLNEMYSRNPTEIDDINTYLELARKYSKIVYDRIFTANKKGFFGETQEIHNVILLNVLNIIPSCVPLVFEQDIACYVTINSIKVIRYATVQIDELLVQEVFLQVLQQIFELLSVESTEDTIITIRVQIYKLITSLNSTFLAKNMKYASNERFQFAALYRAEIIPPIIEATNKMLPAPMSFRLRRWVMDAFYQFMYFEAYGENIFTPDFLINVLLRNARVDEEDVEEPEVNPTSYANIMLDMDLLDDNEYTARTFCAMIIKQAVMKLNLAEPLYPFFFSDSEDIFDFEAKMFLLIKYLKTMMHQERKRRKPLKKKQQNMLGPILPPIRDEDFHSIFEKLQESLPPFVQITLISVCILFFKYNDPKQGIQMSYQIILDCELPIIGYFGAKMFNSCLKHLKKNDEYENVKDELFSNPDLLKVIEKLFVVTKVFNDQASSMIAAIVNSNVDIINSTGVELIHILYELVYDHCVDDETDKNKQSAKNILEDIFNIIVELDDDAPILFQIMNESYGFINKIFEDIYEAFNAYEDIFDILALINQKITHTQQPQVDMLQILLQFWVKVPDVTLNSCRQVCQFIYPLITSEENALGGDQETMQNVTQFVEFLIFQASEEIKNNEIHKFFKYDEPSCSMGYSLFLASCIISVWGNVNTSFLENAISMITPHRFQYISSDNYFLTIMGSFYVLAAYFVVDPQIVGSALNPEMIVAIIEIIQPKYFTKYRDMIVGMIILLNFTKMGFNQAYLAAAKNFKYLIKYKASVEANDDDDDDSSEEGEEEDEEEEADDEIPSFIAQYPVPFDTFDAVQLFKEVSELGGLFSSLEENLQNEIRELI